ncbi:malonate decarboxylase subunit alpha [Frondihabitans sucicola]|uniref:Malonate decarboxylase subunit alpha n=1 Tax=Frondihabitans sucicola TaxID=1268041 RepID=A0ABM8GK46_9MICO|nr:malonate decarboxylase subunit alpha [Frondihabitans sucicola]
MADAETRWTTHRHEKKRRLDALGLSEATKIVDADRIDTVLSTLIQPRDRVSLEGDNQKQADFLAQSLAEADPALLHDLHLLISSVSLPAHLDVFERGIASRLDLAFAGPQSLRLAQLVEDRVVTIGAIHTYVELYARMFVDLPPNVALLCAEAADEHGNLYTGPNTEDTPTIAEATAFHDGIVIVQVNRIVDTLPRVDIPGDWVDAVVVSPRPYKLEPLFTRDPAKIGRVEILKAMLAIRGVYERHEVVSLNHGIGFDTAAIELILPTYGEELGLRGRIAKHWVLNPHPTLIPAIESGWVESVHCFGGEPGMERYVAARPDVFFTGRDGSLRSNRVLAQLAGQYAIDMFIGSSLQIDGEETPPPSRPDAWPDSVERPTWATTRTAAGTAAPRGSTSPRAKERAAAARSSSSNSSRRSRPEARPPSSIDSTPSTSVPRPAWLCRRS